MKSFKDYKKIKKFINNIQYNKVSKLNITCNFETFLFIKEYLTLHNITNIITSTSIDLQKNYYKIIAYNNIVYSMCFFKYCSFIKKIKYNQIYYINQIIQKYNIRQITIEPKIYGTLKYKTIKYLIDLYLCNSFITNNNCSWLYSVDINLYDKDDNIIYPSWCDSQYYIVISDIKYYDYYKLYYDLIPHVKKVILYNIYHAINYKLIPTKRYYAEIIYKFLKEMLFKPPYGIIFKRCLNHFNNLNNILCNKT